ncbi:MAG: hypothetical protein WAL25_04470 [Acidimicrobiia bacterium]
MRKLALFSVFVGLLLAACSPGDAAGDTTTSLAAEVTTSESGSTDTTEPPPEATTTTMADEETTTTAAATGGASCVEGSWVFGAETFLAAMESAMTDADMAGAEVEPTDGTYTVTFEPDGTFTGVRDEWGFAVDSPDGRIVIEMDGTETGTWSADGSTMTVQMDVSDVQVSARVEADGQSFELPTSPVQVPEAIAESSPYQCDSDTLSVNTGEFMFVLDRA